MRVAATAMSAHNVAQRIRRFTTYSEENSLEEAGKWCRLGPKAAAAQLVSELAEVNPLLGDRRRFTSAVNLAKARAVALGKLTREERSAKARAAALARYSKSRKTLGNMGDCTDSQGAGYETKRNLP
jgi:hypothetical protein